MIVDHTAITLLLGIFGLLVLLRVPITFCLAISAIITGTYLNVPLEAIVKVMADGVMNFSLLAIPFFIIMGEIMNEGGISQRLVNLANLLVGRLPGGLAMVNVMDSMFFGGISGSAVADVSSLGSIVIPMMKKQGYDDEFSVGLTICSACQGIIIPPSHNMIIYAFAVGTASQLAGGSMLVVSVGKLFLGGYLPGILMGIMMLLISLIIAIKRKYPRGKGYTLREGTCHPFGWGSFHVYGLNRRGRGHHRHFYGNRSGSLCRALCLYPHLLHLQGSALRQVCKDPLFLPQDVGHCHEPDRCCERLWVSPRPFAGSETGHGVAPLDYGQLLRIALHGQYHAPHPGLHYGHGAPHPHLHPDPLSCPGSEDGNGPGPFWHHASLESLHRTLHPSCGLGPLCGKRRRKNLD